jgi:MoxR-like ATPase
MTPTGNDLSSPFSPLRDGAIVRLPADDRHDASWHQWAQHEIDALTLALAARRPLLVRGEPGTGKTQTARAAAHHLGWALHPITINARTEPQDLLYRFDAVKRLADAQAGKLQDDADYWEPGPLWRAFGWTTARRYGSCRALADEPAGHVILLDEIDKADSDLPNSLLEILGQRAQTIAALRLTLGGPGVTPPLVIATTNEERELPPAFLRRCVVVNLDLEPGRSYEDWLLQRGLAHFGAGEPGRQVLPEPLLRKAARQLSADRSNAEQAGLPPPGAAEYLDLLYALCALAPGRPDRQRELIDRLSAYSFVKHRSDGSSPLLSQRRPPAAGAPPVVA